MIIGIEDLKGNQTGYNDCVDRAKVEKLRKQGMSPADIAETLDTTEVEVLYILQDYKDTLRSY